VAIGNGATASGAVSVAIGPGAIASNNSTTALGDVATASGAQSTAIGQNTKATTLNATAVGTNATVQAANGTALGANSLVMPLAPNSVALGQGSIATQSQTVSVGVPGGERRIMNVAPGVFGTDAVNVNQLSTAVAGLTAEINSVRREERRGIAAVTAAAYAPTPSGPGRTTFAMNGSVFQGEYGVGVAFNHRLSWTTMPVYITGAYGSAGGAQHVGRVGAAFEW
jgi:autotransporter adhesin